MVLEKNSKTMKITYSLFLFIIFSYFQSNATVYTVTNTANSGPGSLRQAITNANGLGADQIVFNISGTAPHIITPLSAFPNLNDDQTVIDGSTQPANGYAGPGPKIIIDGSLAGAAAKCFHISGYGCEIYGLYIKKFASDGIYIDCYNQTANPGFVVGAAGKGNVISNNSGNGITIETGAIHNSFIQGNIIGLDSAGIFSYGNNNGIYFNNTADNIHIGGAAAGEGNVISSNTSNGIAMNNTFTRIFIKGNKIGTDITGTIARGNGGTGVYSNGGGSDSILIGGNSILGEGNLISNNGDKGIMFNGNGWSNIFIKGNQIGTDISGLLPMGNKRSGIATNASVLNNITIGGAVTGEGNIISGNNFFGGPLEGGISISSATGHGNIKNNRIGSDASGNLNIGNKYICLARTRLQTCLIRT